MSKNIINRTMGSESRGEIEHSSKAREGWHSTQGEEIRCLSLAFC